MTENEFSKLKNRIKLISIGDEYGHYTFEEKELDELFNEVEKEFLGCQSIGFALENAKAGKKVFIKYGGFTPQEKIQMALEENRKMKEVIFKYFGVKI